MISRLKKEGEKKEETLDTFHKSHKSLASIECFRHARGETVWMVPFYVQLEQRFWGFERSPLKTSLNASFDSNDGHCLKLVSYS